MRRAFPCVAPPHSYAWWERAQSIWWAHGYPTTMTFWRKARSARKFPLILSKVCCKIRETHHGALSRGPQHGGCHVPIMCHHPSVQLLAEGLSVVPSQDG